MRLFTGIELPFHWRQALAGGTQRLRTMGARGRFTPPENYHLTLVFLGETRRAEEAAAALEQLDAPPFPLRSAPPGVFRRKEGDIWWLGVEPSPGLLLVQRQLEQALEEAGFPVERRPYRPHITLARQVRGQAQLLARPGLFPPLSCQVRRLTLFSSERVDGVLRYRPVARKSLM